MQNLTGDGYFFHQYRTTESAVYYRCTNSRLGCPVRVIRRISTGYVSQSGEHDHPPNFTRLPYLQARQNLVNQAMRMDQASIRDIFNHGRNGEGPFRDLLTFHRLWPSMNRARRSVLPVVHNLSSFVQVLENPTYACVSATTRFDDSVYCGSSVTTAGSRVILFISSKCKQVLMCAEQLFVYITQMSEQNWIVSMAVMLDRLVVQLAWIIVDDVGETTLTAGFVLLRSSLPTFCFTRVLCGNENVARIITSTFGVGPLPSLFDYICDLKQFMSATSISAPIIGQSSKLRDVLNHCCSLPLLPPVFLQLGIDSIFYDCSDFTSFVQSDLQNLFHHITNNWLQHPVKGSAFSVFESKERTNFRCEELKLKAQRNFQNTTDLYIVTNRIVTQTEKTHKLLTKLFENRFVSLDPVSFIETIRVKMLTETLNTPLLPPRIAVKNFLNVTSELLHHINF